MNIKKTIIISLSSLTLLSPIFTSSIANASMWHKGTPKTLHGKYKTHKFGADLMETLDITSSKMQYWEAGMPPEDGYNVSYKTIGKNKYTIKYDAPAIGIFKGGKNLKITLVKSGHNIRIPHDSHTFYKY